MLAHAAWTHEANQKNGGQKGVKRDAEEFEWNENDEENMFIKKKEAEELFQRLLAEEGADADGMAGKDGARSATKRPKVEDDET
jgi:hypothetical protein